jgi:hypothetical protein
MKSILAVTFAIALAITVGQMGCTSGTTYNFTITSGPTGAALTVYDYTAGNNGGPVYTNYVSFINQTDSTVILIGGANWSTFFGQDSITIASQGTITLAINVITNMSGQETIGYSLRYQGQGNVFHPILENPAFIVRPGS